LDAVSGAAFCDVTGFTLLVSTSHHVCVYSVLSVTAFTKSHTHKTFYASAHRHTIFTIQREGEREGEREGGRGREGGREGGRECLLEFIEFWRTSSESSPSCTVV